MVNGFHYGRTQDVFDIKLGQAAPFQVLPLHFIAHGGSIGTQGGGIIMTTLKVVLLGSLLAGALAAGTLVRQSGILGPATEMQCTAGMECQACANSVGHSLASDAACCVPTAGSDPSAAIGSLEYEEEAATCSTCAAEAGGNQLTSDDVVPGEITELSQENLIPTIASSEFEEVVLGAPGLVLVDFYADWCGPCRAQAAVLERVASSLDSATIVKVDVDASPELAGRYEISAIPALLVFDGGEPIDSHVGVADEQQLNALITGQRL